MKKENNFLSIEDEEKSSNFWYEIIKWPTHFLRHVLFSSLLRRIVIVNLAVIIILVSEIMFFSQFRENLVEAKLESLSIQGRIIAGTIVASSIFNNYYDKSKSQLLSKRFLNKKNIESYLYQNSFLQMDYHRVTEVLREIISSEKTFVRVHDINGNLLLDTRLLYFPGQKIFSQTTNSSNFEGANSSGWMGKIDRLIYRIFMSSRDCNYEYPKFDNTSSLPKSIIKDILNGQLSHEIRYCNALGGIDFGVVLPLKNKDQIFGILLISTVDSDIELTVFRERLTIFRMAFVVAVVLMFLSAFLSYTIASPLRRLSEAADKASKRLTERVIVPDFSARSDEIGLLSISFRGLTDAFYKRVEAIEHFAADVSHELKNPLTSLRSAIDTLSLAKTEAQKEKLYSIIKHDLRRLDRLITDISAASRVDSELAKEVTRPIDMAQLIKSYSDALSHTQNDKENFTVEVKIEPLAEGKKYFVSANELRLGQVISNILSNAQSFLPEKNGKIIIELYERDEEIFLTILDNGPGIKADDISKIFQRFYTDRPGSEAFGQNSGLGLSISQQIIEGYGGQLSAENVYSFDNPPKKLGAKFIIKFPIAKKNLSI